MGMGPYSLHSIPSGRVHNAGWGNDVVPRGFSNCIIYGNPVSCYEFNLKHANTFNYVSSCVCVPGL